MGQAHCSSYDTVGELVAVVGTRVREGGSCSVCGAGESFSHLRRGSIVDGTEKGLACGILVEHPVALPLPPKLVRARPLISLPLALPP